MKKLAVIGLVAFTGYLLFGVASFYIGKYIDYWESPWAYSRDEKAILLVGKWEGSFKDPDGIDKVLRLEIRPPESDSERWGRTFKKTARRFANTKGNFDGLAIVNSKLGTEYYDLSGKVQEDNHHQIYLSFHPDENKKKILPNFILLESTDARWDTNTITFLVSFTYHKANNTALYESANPKHKMKVKVNLHRARI